MMTTNPTGKPVKKTPVKKVPTKKVPASNKLGNTSLIPGMGLSKFGYETMSGKKGLSIKKAQDGYTGEPGLLERTGPMRKTKTKQRSPDGNYVTKTVTRTRPGGATKSTKTRRSFQGFLQGAPRVSELINSNKMKNGGAMLRQAPKSTMEKISSTKLKDVPEKAVNVAKKVYKSGKNAVKNTIDKVKNATIGETAENTLELFTGYNPNRKPTKKADKVLSAMAKKNGGKVGKMRNGGSLSGLTASTKRDNGTDPKGAFTKVQKKTLRGAKGKASLTKDKQLGATKMKMGGRMKKC